MKKGIITVIFITILIGLLILLYSAGIIFGLIESRLPVVVLIIVICAALALFGALLYTSFDRIKEIKEEDKDDISKY